VRAPLPFRAPDQSKLPILKLGVLNPPSHT
jgi:hypothetical protein